MTVARNTSLARLAQRSQLLTNKSVYQEDSCKTIMDLKSTPILRRSQSMQSVSTGHMDLKYSEELRFSRTVSESSIEVYVVNDTESDVSTNEQKDSGIDEEVFALLEQKIDRLSDLFMDQCQLLKELKEEVLTHSKDANVLEDSDTAHAHSKCVVDILKKALTETCLKLEEAEFSVEADDSRFSSGARSLLAALQSRPATLNAHIRDALLQFLQSDEVREHVVSATTAAVREIVRQRLRREVSMLYVPLLERSQRRLAKHLTRVLECAFAELEESTSSFSTSIFKTSRSLRRALDRHQALVADLNPVSPADELHKDFKQVLQNELEQWRCKALEALCPPAEEYWEGEAGTPPSEYCPTSPPQPADPHASIIDQLMMTAQINKKISDGDVSGAFELALTAGDLSLVVAACRASDPAVVSQLPRAVLLSLAQQLATDMVHETQLKCRYLEEALINLDQSDQATRAHLPLVVREIRKHLSDFLTKYPGHIASRRITLITMAAYNLLI